MPLPDQEPKDMYTSDEVRHLVAREVMRHRLDQMEQGQLQVKEEITKIGNDITTNNKVLLHEISKLYDSMAKGHKELRLEIERDFATKPELIKLEGKVDTLALKISIVVGAVVFVIQLGMSYFFK